MSHYRTRFFVLALLAFSLPVATFATTTISATPTTPPNLVRGLVGHWTFDGPDMTATQALDKSSNGNHGTLVSVATSSRVAGKLGQAIRFDGYGNVDSGSASSLDNISNMTISLWIYQTSDTGYITAKKATTGWRVRLAGGKVLFFRDFSTNDGNWQTNSNFPLNQWSHLVIIYDSSSNANDPVFYVNGVVSSSSETGVPGGSAVTDAGSNLVINDSSLGASGVFDDVRIYNRILTPAEVKQLYNLGQVTINKTPPPSQKTAGGLVGWWTFDGKDVDWRANKVLDRSGLGNHGAIINMATATAGKPGKIGQGFRFDGVNDYIDAGSPASYDNTAPMSVSLWIVPKRSTAGGGNQWIVGKASDATPSDGWFLGLGNTQGCGGNLLNFNIARTAGLPNYTIPVSVLVLRTWQHVVVTWTGVMSNDAQFYVNAVLQGNNCSQNGGTRANDSAQNLTIGNDVGNTLPFDGTIDDVRIYNRILTAQEIKDLYNQTKGSTIGFMCGKDTVRDVDGNTYHTLKIGSQCWMKENMRVGTRINVSSNQTNNAVIEKYCYDDTPSNCTTNHPNTPDGGLYQWDEAMQYVNIAKARGICPSGWHIPTHDEFTTLERAICTSGSCATDFPYDTTTTGNRGTDEGTKLKSNGTSRWEGNRSGFSFGGPFLSRDTTGYFWSSSSNGGSLAWYRSLSFAQVYRFTYDKSYGMPVRCVKN